ICKPWLTADIIRLSQFKWPLRGTFRLQGASSYDFFLKSFMSFMSFMCFMVKLPKLGFNVKASLFSN
ncbi:MAG: hypothetical protein CVV06_08535, partial [Gammaproteobacteria bacterium HGW-Gammaproteobacteria-10]